MNKTIEIKLIQEDGRVFIDMPTNESNPCLNCGACCNYFRISFYHGECPMRLFLVCEIGQSLEIFLI
jgi:hypothetical protein